MIRKISFCIALFAAVQAFARDEYTRNFDKTLSLQSGQTVRIENKFGDVVVRTHARPELVVHAVIRVSAWDAAEAKRFGDSIRISVEPAGSAMLVETVYPKRGWEISLFGHSSSYSVTYEILMPESAPLELKNSFGAAIVSDLKANGEITTSHGRLEFRNGRGNQRLETAFAAALVLNNTGDVTLTNTNGSVDVSDVTGSISVRDRFGKVSVMRTGPGSIVNGNGAVDVSKVSGRMSVTTSFASVHAHDIKGNLIVKNQNGEVDATGVAGSAELSTSFAKVHFEDIAGPLTVKAENTAIAGKNVAGPVIVQTSFAAVDISGARKGINVISQNGSVALGDIGEDASVKTSFALVKADRIGGSIHVENQNGAVNAFGVRGGANVKTSFGGIVIDGAGGAIEVEDQNGSVQITAGPARECKPLSIRTSFASLQVRIPENGSYTVNAKTSFGKIHSDLPMLVSGALTPDVVNGKIGAGACPMNLINQNGSIEILNGHK